MGTRTDIKLVYENGGKIYLYSHWQYPDDLKKVIKSVLQRKLRWDDYSYLARMIFSAMVREEIDAETGYGLSLNEMGTYEVVVDLVKQTVDGIPYEEFINQ